MSELFTERNSTYEQGAISLTVVNNVTKEQQIVVPAGMLWKLLSIKVMNPDDVARDLYVEIWQEAAKTTLIRRLTGKTAIGAGGRLQWPSKIVDHSVNGLWCDVVLAGLNAIVITLLAGGASAGGTDADGITYEHLQKEF